MSHQIKFVDGKKIKIYSLVFITDPEKKRVLLGMKKRGFGIGKFNGFGGKLAENETIEECAIREVNEECSLEVREDKMEKIAIVVYEFENSEFLMEVHFFHTSHFTGTIEESDEMKPEWFNIDNVPFDTMWVDDFHWYPFFVRGDHFNGYFLFKNEQDIIYQHLVSVDKSVEIKPIYGKIESTQSFGV